MAVVLGGGGVPDRTDLSGLTIGSNFEKLTICCKYDKSKMHLGPPW